MNNDSNSTYYFITGPNLPDSGGKLTLPSQKAVSGNPGSFTVVKTNPDKTWDYPWLASGLRLEIRNVYPLRSERAKNRKSVGRDTISFAQHNNQSTLHNRKYLFFECCKGAALTITTGLRKGSPREVQIWIFGNNYAFNITTPVNSDASFTFNGDATITGKLPAGQNYLIVQHPMADNQFDIVVSGDYVRDLKLNNGTNFLSSPARSLQGSDATDALTAAFHDRMANDDTLTNDTYTLIPFQVTDAGSSTHQAQPATTSPVQRQSQHAPLQYAPVGAIELFLELQCGIDVKGSLSFRNYQEARIPPSSFVRLPGAVVPVFLPLFRLGGVPSGAAALLARRSMSSMIQIALPETHDR